MPTCISMRSVRSLSRALRPLQHGLPRQAAIGALALFVAALPLGCSTDPSITDPVAAIFSGVVLTTSKAYVPKSGGQAELTATVVSKDGRPLKDVKVVLETTAGELSPGTEVVTDTFEFTSAAPTANGALLGPTQSLNNGDLVSTSFDPDGQIVLLEWDIDQDDVFNENGPNGTAIPTDLDKRRMSLSPDRRRRTPAPAREPGEIALARLDRLLRGRLRFRLHRCRIFADVPPPIAREQA